MPALAGLRSQHPATDIAGDGQADHLHAPVRHLAGKLQAAGRGIQGPRRTGTAHGRSSRPCADYYPMRPESALVGQCHAAAELLVGGPAGGRAGTAHPQSPSAWACASSEFAVIAAASAASRARRQSSMRPSAKHKGCPASALQSGDIQRHGRLLRPRLCLRQASRPSGGGSSRRSPAAMPICDRQRMGASGRWQGASRQATMASQPGLRPAGFARGLPAGGAGPVPPGPVATRGDQCQRLVVVVAPRLRLRGLQVGRRGGGILGALEMLGRQRRVARAKTTARRACNWRRRALSSAAAGAIPDQRMPEQQAVAIRQQEVVQQAATVLGRVVQHPAQGVQREPLAPAPTRPAEGRGPPPPGDPCARQHQTLDRPWQPCRTPSPACSSNCSETAGCPGRARSSSGRRRRRNHVERSRKRAMAPGSSGARIQHLQAAAFREMRCHIAIAPCRAQQQQRVARPAARSARRPTRWHRPSAGPRPAAAAAAGPLPGCGQRAQGDSLPRRRTESGIVTGQAPGIVVQGFVQQAGQGNALLGRRDRGRGPRGCGPARAPPRCRDRC